MKGILKDILIGAEVVNLAKEIGKGNRAPITRYYPKLPRNEGATRASLLIEVANIEAARDLYN